MSDYGHSDSVNFARQILRVAANISYHNGEARIKRRFKKSKIKFLCKISCGMRPVAVLHSRVPSMLFCSKIILTILILSNPQIPTRYHFIFFFKGSSSREAESPHSEKSLQRPESMCSRALPRLPRALHGSTLCPEKKKKKNRILEGGEGPGMNGFRLVGGRPALRVHGKRSNAVHSLESVIVYSGAANVRRSLRCLR